MALTTVSSGMIANTGVTAGVYGNSGNIVSITVNSEGQITAASNVAVSIQASAGSVLQVVNATTSTQVVVTGGTYTDSTLTATITPKFSTSKILILVSQPYRVYNQTNTAYSSGGIQLLRNSTVILAPVADSTGPYALSVQTQNLSNPNPNARAIFSCNYLDSPATTSATTYKTQLRRYGSESSILVQETDANGTNTAVITLMEIAA